MAGQPTRHNVAAPPEMNKALLRAYWMLVSPYIGLIKPWYHTSSPNSAFHLSPWNTDLVPKKKGARPLNQPEIGATPFDRVWGCLDFAWMGVDQIMVNWWFGFLGSPYERDWYLGVTVESQTTNPNHQFTISWMDSCLKEGSFEDGIPDTFPSKAAKI